MIVLGIIQGLTEFFPVSSKGHLALGERLLGVDLHTSDELATEIALHVGTLLAVALFVWRDVAMLVKLPMQATSPAAAPARSLLVRMVIATIPAAVVGLLFKDRLEPTYSDPRFAGAGFLVTATALLVARRIRHGEATATSQTLLSALLIGLAQMCALLPGVSRSGSTIVAGLAVGLARPEAGRFSFLIALPITAGAILLEAPAVLELPRDQLGAVGIGILASFVTGLFALRFLIRMLRNDTFWRFAWYLIPLGVWALLGLPGAPQN